MQECFVKFCKRNIYASGLQGMNSLLNGFVSDKQHGTSVASAGLCGRDSLKMTMGHRFWDLIRKTQRSPFKNAKHLTKEHLLLSSNLGFN